MWNLEPRNGFKLTVQRQTLNFTEHGGKQGDKSDIRTAKIIEESWNPFLFGACKARQDNHGNMMTEGFLMVKFLGFFTHKVR